MKKLISLLFLISFLNFSSVANVEHAIDFQKLVLELNFNTNEESVNGIATYTFKPLLTEITQIILNSKDLNIVSVEIEGLDLDFINHDGLLTISLNNPLSWNNSYELKIDYNSQPRAGLYFVGWKDVSNRAKKQIWSQYSKKGNWYPFYNAVEDKLITETIITFDNKFEVISNGKLISKKKKGNSNTWHYAMQNPHSLYLLMVAIGEYDYKEFKSVTGVTTVQYYYPEEKQALETTFKFTNRMMKWVNNELGDFPWSIHRNVPARDFMYGAMENTTVTLFSDLFLTAKSTDKQYLALSTHELVHQWIGNSVTAWTGNSHWIQEGLATNYSKHFIREIEGEDEYKWICRQELLASIDAETKNNYPVAYVNAGTVRHYDKASYILDMLRYIVGEEEYKKTIKQFLEDNKYGMIDSHDFQMAFKKTLGINLDWFFNEWVYGGGIPVYNISYKTKSNKTLFTVNQTQQTKNVSLFKMPIVFQVHYKDGTYDEITKWIKKSKQTIIVPNKSFKRVSYVLFDPNSNILKEVKFDKSIEELTNQANHAKNMIDRYDAVDEMRFIEVSKKREILIEIYLKENHRAIKENILDQLKNDIHSNSLQLFVYAIAEKDIRLRKFAVENIQFKTKRYLKFYEEILKDESPEIAEIGLNKLCDFYPSMKQEYLNRTRAYVEENLSFKISWLVLKFGSQKKLFSEIVDYSSESFNFKIRIKSISILGKINYFDRFYMANLVDAYLSDIPPLKKEAKKQLGIFLKDNKVGPIVTNYISNHKWNPKDEEILDELLIKYNRKIYK